MIHSASTDRFELLKYMLREASSLISDMRRTHIETTLKGGNPGDLVTTADTAAEDYLFVLLTQNDPGISVVREEFSPSHRRRDLDQVWCIDPIDGTVNFARGVPALSAISIGYWEGGIPSLGGILRLDEDSQFLADGSCAVMRHGGTMTKLHTKCHPKEQRVIAMDVPLRAQHLVERGMSFYDALRFDVGGVRMLGSATLALAGVAAGWFDAYVNFTMGPWDVAAGQALVEQAGGIVVNDRGERRQFWDPTVIAGADQKTVDHLLGIIQVL